MPADAATDGPVPGGRVELRSDAEDAGQRLDRVLQRHLLELSRTRFKQLILAGEVPSARASQRGPSQRAQSPAFAGRRIERAYSAFVWGVPVPTTGEISGNIGRSPRNRNKMAVVPEGRGRSAVTRYRVERRYADHAALIECRLLTGRTHQIRVHLSHAGHPLIGDPVYGTRSGRAAARLGPAGASISAFPRQALHARLLGFTHPATGEKLRFESPLPADLAELKRNLELL